MTARTNVTKPVVGLFVTCAVDLLRPSVGFATAKLLEDAGCQVFVPAQSCCGQVAYNNGLPSQTRSLALDVAKAFADVEFVVTPSGSCASMLRNHYPSLFDGQNTAVNEFAAKVYELTCFLADVLQIQNQYPRAERGTKTIAYHDSCAGMRELDIRQQPRILIQHMRGDSLADITEGETCCGFGGTFCVKFADISNKMVSEKVANIENQEPDLLLGGDLTCLINLAGKLQRLGDDDIEVRHIAEYLAGDTDTPAIGLQK